MSRSYRKTKVFGMTCASSDKQGKKISSRIHRSVERQILKTCDISETPDFPTGKTLYNNWNFPKDGKHYWRNATEKDMRK